MTLEQTATAYTYNIGTTWEVQKNVTKNTMGFQYRYGNNNNVVQRKRASNFVLHAIYFGGDLLVNVNFKMVKNIQRLDKIASMPDNWNENNAKHFTKELVDKCKRIISILSIQPELFPTANNSIQMEYEKENGEYLELNVRENCVDVYLTYKDESEEEYSITSQEEQKIKETVDNFYARN